MTKQWGWPSDTVVLQLARPLAAFLLTLLILLGLRHLSIKWLYRRSKGEGTVGYIALETLRLPSLLWCVAAAVKFGLEMSIIPQKYTGPASTAIFAFLIVSISMVVASASVRALTAHGRRRGIALALSGMASTLIRVFVYTLGLTALLRLYQVNIAPLLAALGVGGLAVALALQDSLANFFAGIHILIEAPIALGSFIRLSTGEEGVVTDIGWRTTRVRNGNSNIVVIPNTKITSGILINYNLPDARVTTDIAVMVGYDADLDQVRRLALEETRACDDVLETPEPSVFFNPGVLPTHLQFTVVFSVADVSHKGPVQSEVRLRIHHRLREEGVPLPLPWYEAKMLATD
jgi:small-conductance mechanosensitive channel